VALVYAAALAAAAPLLARGRFRAEPGAGVATASVLIFPVAAAAAAWAFLEWRFTGRAFATIRSDGTLFHFPDGVLAGLANAIGHTGSIVLRAPVYIAVGLLLFLRKPVAVAGYALPLVGLVLAWWIGLPYAGVTAFMLLAAVAIVTAPVNPRGWVARLLVGAAALQVVVGAVAINYPADIQRFLSVLW
jgi:hypothetical protein